MIFVSKKINLSNWYCKQVNH